MVGEGVQARELGVDGLGEREGVEGGPQVLEVGHPHRLGLGAGLDALEGRLRDPPLQESSRLALAADLGLPNRSVWQIPNLRLAQR